MRHDHSHIHPAPRIEPIVPTARPLPFSDPAWLFEPKYDGFRGMLYLTRHACSLYSKRGNRMTRFQDLAGQVRPSSAGGNSF
jgi:ATP-dependent DNA ligase